MFDRKPFGVSSAHTVQRTPGRGHTTSVPALGSFQQSKYSSTHPTRKQYTPPLGWEAKEHKNCAEYKYPTCKSPRCRRLCCRCCCCCCCCRSCSFALDCCSPWLCRLAALRRLRSIASRSGVLTACLARRATSPRRRQRREKQKDTYTKKQGIITMRAFGEI